MDIKIKVEIIILIVVVAVLQFQNCNLKKQNENIKQQYDNAIGLNVAYQQDSTENAKLQIEKDRVIDSLSNQKKEIIEHNHETIREIYLVTNADYIDSLLAAKYDSAYTFRFSSIIKKADSVGNSTKLGRPGPVIKSR